MKRLTDTWFWIVFWIVAVVAALLLTYSVVWAHDNSNPELNKWFENLRSGKGPCCSGHDAVFLSDVQWQTKGNHYQVWIDASPGPGVKYDWVDVPPEAVLDGPNKAGVAVVWPLRNFNGMTVRCFMPGPWN